MLALQHRSQKDANRACVVALRPGGRKWSLQGCFAIEMTQTMLATWHCGLKDANHACLGRICDLTDGKHACLKDANHACLGRISDLMDENHACFAAS